MKEAVVPCNGCTACCENDLIVLHPEEGDDPSQYETMAAINPVSGLPCLALKHKPEGGCVYLERGVGCTIHGRAPVICKTFDCRGLAKRIAESFTKAERKDLFKRGVLSRRTLQAGFDRLSTL